MPHRLAKAQPGNPTGFTSAEDLAKRIAGEILANDIECKSRFEGLENVLAMAKRFDVLADEVEVDHWLLRPEFDGNFAVSNSTPFSNMRQ